MSEIKRLQGWSKGRFTSLKFIVVKLVRLGKSLLAQKKKQKFWANGVNEVCNKDRCFP